MLYWDEFDRAWARDAYGRRLRVWLQTVWWQLHALLRMPGFIACQTWTSSASRVLALQQSRKGQVWGGQSLNMAQTCKNICKWNLPNFSSSSTLPCTPGWSAKQKLTSAGVPCRHDT